jgi:hypothetical protein
MSLSREEVRNTVQSLIGPGFKVNISLNELDYIRSLSGQEVGLAILEQVKKQLVMNMAPQSKIVFWQKRIDEIKKDLEIKNNVVAIDKFYPINNLVGMHSNGSQGAQNVKERVHVTERILPGSVLAPLPEPRGRRFRT